jgi:hypothetical protein
MHGLQTREVEGKMERAGVDHIRGNAAAEQVLVPVEVGGTCGFQRFRRMQLPAC